jgi:hypothetical protein
MTNIVKPERWWSERQPPDPPEPPMDLSARIGKLETFADKATERLARIETRLEAVATREDLHKEMNAQTWRIIGGMIAIAGLALAAVRLFMTS